MEGTRYNIITYNYALTFCFPHCFMTLEVKGSEFTIFHAFTVCVPKVNEFIVPKIR